MKGAVDDGVAVKEDQKRAAHGIIITEGRGKGVRGRKHEIRISKYEVSNMKIKTGQRQVNILILII